MNNPETILDDNRLLCETPEHDEQTCHGVGEIGQGATQILFAFGAEEEGGQDAALEFEAEEDDVSLQSEWRKTANTYTPERWKDLIDSIEDMTVRIQVASIVWWDYFGGRKASDAWHQLDEYIDAWRFNNGADVLDVEEALVKIGFPRYVAHRRSLGCVLEETEVF
jgi:hypothetical protein